MKQILTWNNDIAMYNVRFATKEESDIIDNAIEKLNHLKYLYYEIAKDADEADLPIDRFIDDEAYGTHCAMCNLAREIINMTKGLIVLDVWKYVYDF